MEENSQQKKNRLQQIYTQAQTSFFNIMFELLKEKKTSKRRGILLHLGVFVGCGILLISFIQIIGHIFEPQVGN